MPVGLYLGVARPLFWCRTCDLLRLDAYVCSHKFPKTCLSMCKLSVTVHVILFLGIVYYIIYHFSCNTFWIQCKTRLANTSYANVYVRARVRTRITTHLPIAAAISSCLSWYSCIILRLSLLRWYTDIMRINKSESEFSTGEFWKIVVLIDDFYYNQGVQRAEWVIIGGKQLWAIHNSLQPRRGDYIIPFWN